VSAVGGGSRSRLWAQIKADVLGVPYARLHTFVNAARGAALVAAAGTGLCAIDDARWFDPSLIVADQQEPNLENTSAYAPYVELNRTLLDGLKRVYHGLNQHHHDAEIDAEVDR
jgi:xylulokinase